MSWKRTYPPCRPSCHGPLHVGPRACLASDDDDDGKEGAERREGDHGRARGLPRGDGPDRAAAAGDVLSGAAADRHDPVRQRAAGRADQRLLGRGGADGRCAGRQPGGLRSAGGPARQPARPTRGRPRLLPVFSLANALAIAGLVAGALAWPATPVLVLLGACAGVTVPQLGPMARARRSRSPAAPGPATPRWVPRCASRAPGRDLVRPGPGPAGPRGGDGTSGVRPGRGGGAVPPAAPASHCTGPRWRHGPDRKDAHRRNDAPGPRRQPPPRPEPHPPRRPLPARRPRSPVRHVRCLPGLHHRVHRAARAAGSGGVRVRRHGSDERGRGTLHGRGARPRRADTRWRATAAAACTLPLPWTDALPARYATVTVLGVACAPHLALTARPELYTGRTVGESDRL